MDPTEATPAPSDALGSFRLVRELGRGAMGVVYEAFQPELQRRVALKVIAPEVLAGDDRARERFMREARAAAKVRHPGIVTVHEVGAADGRAWLAMEFVEGRPLGAVTDLVPREAARITAEVARAVAALHEHGIVHRDLKPDNILLDRDGRARVTDFGLALLRGQDDHDTSAGTPGFMAPEQLTARYGPTTERTDVYALGAVLHALLTGRRPHDGTSVVEVVMSTIERDLPPTIAAAGVPAELSAICRRCLERLPHDRYASANALADDLDRFLRGDAPEASPPGRLRRAHLFCRRRRMLSARLLALLAFEVLTVFDYVSLGATPLRYFVAIQAVIATLLAATLVLDWSNRRGALLRSTRYVWPLLDCAGLTLLLHLGDGLHSALVVLYPLLILSTGFWLDRRVVVATTAMTVAGYGLLAALPRSWAPPSVDQHLAVVTTLLVTGAMVALQTARTKALRDYAARRR